MDRHWNRLINNKAKFEFEDHAWATVNRHAILPDAGRRVLETTINLYLLFCRVDERPRNSEIKDELKSFAKKAAALSRALNKLSRGATMELIMLKDFTSLNNSDEVIIGLSNLATNAARALGEQRRGPKARNRNWLITQAAIIYEVYSGRKFADLVEEHAKDFVYELLYAAGIPKDKNIRAIDDAIHACLTGPLADTSASMFITKRRN
jgi:hypothetical protein